MIDTSLPWAHVSFHISTGSSHAFKVEALRRERGVSVCSDLIPVPCFSSAGLNEATGKLLKVWVESSSLDAVVNSWMVQSQCYIRLRKSKTLRLPAAQRFGFPSHVHWILHQILLLWEYFTTATLQIHRIQVWRCTQLEAAGFAFWLESVQYSALNITASWVSASAFDRQFFSVSQSQGILPKIPAPM